MLPPATALDEVTEALNGLIFLSVAKIAGLNDLEPGTPHRNCRDDGGRPIPLRPLVRSIWTSKYKISTLYT